MENLNAEQVINELDCQTRFAKFSNSNGVLISVKCAQFVLDHVQYYEQRIKELTEENEGLKADKGYAQGVRDFAERVKNYYRHMTSKALPATVEYYIDQIEKEMLEGDGK